MDSSNRAHHQEDDKGIELSQLEVTPSRRADDALKQDDTIIAVKKTHLDTLSVWQALKVYRKISLLCAMAAASA